MANQMEKRARGTFLALMVVATILLGVVSIGAIATSRYITAITILLPTLGISWTVYREFLKPAEEIVKTEKPNIDSTTLGIRPDESFSGLDITPEDIEMAQLNPKELAHIIMNSPDWKSNGSGNYSKTVRHHLKHLFHSDRVSTLTTEITLIGLVSAFYLLFFATMLSIMPESSDFWLSNLASSIYPETSQSSKALISVLSLGLGSVFLSYFTFKEESRCPICDMPFSLESYERYYKPEKQYEEERKENDELVTYRVTPGVHIFRCEDCEKWHVFDRVWETRIS